MLPLILFVAFLVIPVLEIAVFIQIGDAIGLLPTLAGCVVTALIGALLVRIQGFGVLQSAQKALARRELPVDQLAHAVMIFAAGILLMTPGYITDSIGFLLLAPPIRAAIARASKLMIKNKAEFWVSQPDKCSARHREADGGGDKTIEGEATDITEKV